MNWFQRHLNWTVVLTFVSCYLLLIGLGIGGMSEADAVWVSLLLLVLGLAVAGWTLKKKRRSLRWSLVFLIPFG